MRRRSRETRLAAKVKLDGAGRARIDTGLPFLDHRKAAHVDPRLITVPLLFVAAGLDRLTPPGVVHRAMRYFGTNADYVEYADQGHWVVGQPGWQQTADDVVAWLEAKVAGTCRS